MPQMSPIGWAWISFLVVFIYLFYLACFYYFYFVLPSFKTVGFSGICWFWEW